MFALMIFGGLIYGLSTPTYQDFSRHSNGNASYKVALTNPCKTGKRASGYALTPTNFILLKQKSWSGEVGDICQ